MWNFARTQSADGKGSAAKDSALNRVLGSGMFEPLEPPTAKRDRPLYIDDVIVAEAEAEAFAL